MSCTTPTQRISSISSNRNYIHITCWYRAEPEGTGLFGYSYDRLFTLSDFTRGALLFNRFGVSSPGIVVPDSQVYALCEELCLKGTQRDIRLHLHERHGGIRTE